MLNWLISLFVEIFFENYNIGDYKVLNQRTYKRTDDFINKQHINSIYNI